MTCVEPIKKRVVAFFDSQNLFQSAKNAWGYSFPNFDPIELSKMIVRAHAPDQWWLRGIRIYTGIHDHSINPKWHKFWANKLNAHKAKDSRVHFFTTPLRYSNGVAREKGVDVRIAIDLVVMAIEDKYDVALLFSQDNDLSQAATEIRSIVQKQQRWIKIASAYPYAAGSPNHRGVDKTDWIHIDKAQYDSCIDSAKY
ncbi:NYN domain-containing protein [Synergistaceae bacterium OttesenSCG-928-I11]|nr:NYN domain-containing protein [Synergistaceae bacterium OttesenSCG-928-I11]